MGLLDSLRVSVYVLSDPITQEVRYVGVSRNPRKRFLVHMSVARIGRSSRHSFKHGHLTNWIRKLARQQGVPKMEVIETCGKEWPDRERFWIEHYKSKGMKLTNCTKGGEGTYGHKQSLEVREKHGKAIREFCVNPAVRLKRSQRLMGHYVSKETGNKISQAKTGIPLSNRHKKSIAGGLLAYYAGQRLVSIVLPCAVCGEGFRKIEPQQRFCSASCRSTAGTRAFRKRKMLTVRDESGL